MWFLIATVLLLTYIYYKCIETHNYWKNRGVKYAKPWPLVGSMLPLALKKVSSADFISNLYNQFPEERYAGIFQFTRPTLLIRDPDLITTVTIKNFDNFTDHVTSVNSDVDPLWGKNLVSSEGDRWRSLRQTVSPVFTSSKIKGMFSLMDECSQKLTAYFVNQDNDLITVDMKDTLRRFTNDVIASTSFGITCDSLKDRNNDFFLSGTELTEVTGLKTIAFLCTSSFPALSKFLHLKIVDTKVGNFFRSIIDETIAMREKNNIVRPDLIHLMMMARNGKVKNEETSLVSDSGFATVEEFNKTEKTEYLTNEDITAQALIFFFGGFDSSSSMMSFAFYELAINPDIQTRVRQEIGIVCENGKITYDRISEMKYLDMVISETLRKWTQAVWLDRKCTKPFLIEPTKEGESAVQINVGDGIMIPVFAIHRDPKYYPNPEKFDPERFSEENKSKIDPKTYLPFGSGPRNCIGSRFALVEAKVVMVHLLKTFEIVPVAETQIPLKLSKKVLNLNGEKGIHLGLKRLRSMTND